MKILIAYDGSDLSKKALNQAIDLSKKYNANLLLLTVTQHVCPISVTEEDCKKLDEILMKETEDLLNGIKKELEGHNIVAETYVKMGSPAEEIVNLAKEKNVDLIVLGSHGRHGAKKFLLGSVSLRVAETSPCAVMIVK